MRPELWQAADTAAFLNIPGPESHKYNRGVLGLRTGSSRYPGAAVLGAEAAWRTGIGLVRFFAPLGDSSPAHALPSPAAAILAKRPETVFSSGSDEDRRSCDAWLVGSGTDPGVRSPAERAALLDLLAGSAPVVVDAGALELVQAARTASQLYAPVVITPHLGEFRRLWRSAWPQHTAPAPPESEPEHAASILAAHLGVTVLLKGARSISASPDGAVFVHGPATPWLATAGTGDVLAGILGALVATHAAQIHERPELLAKLGATAAMLHDIAARIASGDDTACGKGGPITGLDVAQSLSQAVQRLRG